MQYRDKRPAVLGVVRKTVMLCFNDDVLHSAGFDDFGNHTAKFAFLFDVAHSAQLFFRLSPVQKTASSSGIIHRLNEASPVWYTRQV